MSSLKKSFGNNLKLLRKSKDITQEKLAELADVHPQQISKIETGGYFPSCKTIEKLCLMLNVAPKDLFDFDLDAEEGYETSVHEMLDKFKKVAKVPERVKFIKLALDALDDKQALEQLSNQIEGIKLSQAK